MSTPTQISSCARATTTEEARFRIDYPLAAARNTRVVALDAAAETIVRTAAAQDWDQARFYVAHDPGHDLVTMDGETVPLAGELEHSNTVVMVSTTGESAEAAATIGAACKVRGIMTAGLVVTPGQLSSGALLTLRPYARILLVPADEDDLVELLRATRA
ncbi:hypothetical protein [Nocardioides sp. NPDC047086]|uniref:hypothetical protein n=1 Tax=Nocardioides sp. NPDC047086 TaxID=3154810 RepID=UPI00340C5A59